MKKNVIDIPHWNIEEEMGYKPITTFWQDFSIADKYGVYEILDTFIRAFKEWNDDYKYLTELTLVLNHKIFQHYIPGGTKEQNRKSAIYDLLWTKAREYALDHLQGEEAEYFYRVTD